MAATRHHHGLVRAAGLEAPGHPRLSSPFAWGRRPVWRCGSSGEERPSEDGGERSIVRLVWPPLPPGWQEEGISDWNLCGAE